MTIYYIPTEKLYLESIADFVLESYSASISNVKIIVPSGVICAQLQNIFVRKSRSGATILPSIIPISAVSSASELVYKIPSENIEAIGYIEQKLLLIDIIEKYEGYNFSMLQASHLSDQLLKLFHEIEAGQIDISELPAVVEIDSALHWMFTAKFLTESYKQWQQSIQESGKISPMVHQKLILDIEKQDSQKNIIIAGITQGSKSLTEFINFLAESERGVAIPPPFSPNDIKNEIEPISPFYRIKNLLESNPSYKFNPQKIKELPYFNQSKEQSAAIEYIEAVSEHEEAELIARIVAYRSAKGNVAVVTNNNELISLASIALQKYSLNLCNLRGIALKNSKPVEFILLLASSILEDDIEKFAAFLKTSFITCEDAHNFEINYIRKEGINTLSALMLNYEISNDKDQAKDWFKILKAKLKPLYNMKDRSHKFLAILKTHLECAVEIAPAIFAGEDGLAACEFFRELLLSSDNLGVVEITIYPELLKQLLGGAKYFPENTSNIVAISPQDAALMDFDTFIIADCVEGSFPYISPPDPWMTRKMRKQIDLRSDEESISEEHYYFTLLTGKRKVYITLAKKSKVSENIISRFLALMLADLEKRGVLESLNPKYNWLGKNIFDSSLNYNLLQENQGHKHLPKLSSAITFPSTIAATNIELLLRNPYGFYAKKILNLYKQNDINMEASSADFGALIHKIIEVYTRQYDSKREDNLQYFLSLGNKIFNEFYDHHKSGSWQARFKAIAEEFIIFDEKRRKNLQTVYFEIHGEMSVKIRGKEIKITAIADRIELTKSGEIFIIDYKTGSVPTTQSVLNGMSPQLIIEAMIAAEGGFKDIPTLVPAKLIYVKVASSKPYFNETMIVLNDNELEKHKNGIIDLLQYYLSSEAEFVATPSQSYEPEYNDYRHLARKV